MCPSHPSPPNMRKLTRFGLLLAFSGMLALAFTGCTRHARMSRHLTRADDYFIASDYGSAEVEYLNVLHLEPQNPEATARLGIIYLEEGRIARAYPLLLKARELKPENLELRLNLSLAYLTMGDFKDARAEALYVLGRNPHAVHAPMLLAEAATNAKEVEAARQDLKKLPAPADQEPPVLAALAALDLRQKELKAAEMEVKRALTLDPKSDDVMTVLGTWYLAQHDYAGAEKAYTDAGKLATPRSSKKLLYPRLELQRGHTENARHALEDLIKKTPDFEPATIMLAQIAASEKKLDESSSLINAVLDRDPANLEALVLAAKLRLAKGETSKAVAAFEQIRTRFPKFPDARYWLAQGYLASGDQEKASASLTQALSLRPGYIDAEILLAEIDLRKHDTGSAIAVLKRTVQEHPDYVRAQLLLADSYRRQGDYESALALYNSLVKTYPKNSQLHLAIGLILLQQNQKGEARKAFNQALAANPDYGPAIEQSVRLDVGEKNFAAARQRVDQQIAKNPKLPGPRLLLAELLLAQHDTAGADVALRKVIELQPNAVGAYHLLAQIDLRTNQGQKALSDLQAAVKVRPQDTAALMEIGILQSSGKDYAAARATYEKLLTVDPKFGPALNNLAYLYSEKFGLLDQAYDLASRAVQAAPNDPHALDTLGWILYEKHQYPRAINSLQEAAADAPNEAEAQFHLGMAQYMSGQVDAARTSLQHALQISPAFAGRDEAVRRVAILAIDDRAVKSENRALLEKAAADPAGDPVALSRLVFLYEKDGALDKAIAAGERARKLGANDPAILVQLARLYAATHENAKAMQLAKAAHGAAPDDPAVSHTLGVLAFEQGDYPWALSLLEDASTKQPDDPDTLFDFARASYSVGRVNDATAALHHALEATTPFPRAAQAQSFLELLSLTAEPSQAVAQAATVDRALASDPASVPALMARATAFEQKREAPAAIETYEKVLERYPDFVPAKRELILLYAKNPANDEKTLALGAKAREAFPDDAKLMKALGIASYRQEKYSRSAELLQNCADSTTGDSEVYYFLGMAQYHTKRLLASKQSLWTALQLGLSGDEQADAKKTLAELK